MFKFRSVLLFCRILGYQCQGISIQYLFVRTPMTQTLRNADDH